MNVTRWFELAAYGQSLIYPLTTSNSLFLLTFTECMSTGGGVMRHVYCRQHLRSSSAHALNSLITESGSPGGGGLYAYFISKHRDKICSLILRW